MRCKRAKRTLKQVNKPMGELEKRPFLVSFRLVRSLLLILCLLMTVQKGTTVSLALRLQKGTEKKGEHI